MASKDMYGGYGSNPVYETLMTPSEIKAKRLAEQQKYLAEGLAHDAGYSELMNEEASRAAAKRRAFEQLLAKEPQGLRLSSNPLEDLNVLKEQQAQLAAEEQQAKIERAKEEVAHATLIEDEMYRNRRTPSIEEVASLVIKGRLGNGKERIKNIKAMGLDPRAVQNVVNQIMWGA